MGKYLTRRQFLTTTLAAGAGAVLAGKAVVTNYPPAGVYSNLDPLQMVTLGKSGIKTTLLGMGTGFSGYNRSSNITRSGKAETIIRYAYEKGIRFFDCADSYGTHPFTAAALKGVPRDSYTLISKIWVGPGGIPGSERQDADLVVDRFRKELKTDYLDLVQIHCMTDERWTDKQKKQMDILENLKVKQIISAHGVSVHSLEAMELCVDDPWIDVIHVRVNPYGDSMDRSRPSEVIPVIARLHKAGKGVIGMKLIGNGNFSNDSEKIDASLKYVLGLGSVDMIIVGFEKPEQIDNYLERMKKALLARQQS
jgi:aryl-alcohol dehydrogenase-like predicted oxidoreductase